MSRRPPVSVIMAVRNGERFLEGALDSIRWQTSGCPEIVIVDDGSTDATAALLAAARDLIVLRQPRRGPAAARNRGLQAASGEFIAFLDADDLWPADKLRRQLDRLTADPELDVVLGQIQPFDVTGAALGDPAPGVQLGGALFRGAVFDQVGLFDERLQFSEDHDWFLRAREAGARMVVAPETTLLYRRHPASMTQSSAANYNLPAVLKASLDRRRATGGSGRSLPRLAEFAEKKHDDLAG